MKSKKLNLQEINVKSFSTDNTKDSKGGIWTVYSNSCTEPWRCDGSDMWCTEWACTMEACTFSC